MLSAVLLAIAGQPPVSFIKDVAPILKESCLGCHDSRKASGKYDLSTYEKLRVGGSNGDPISPGDPEASEFYTLIVSHEKRRMPPRDKGEAVASAKAAIVKQWIAEGAKLDAGLAPTADVIRELRKRWVPPTPPAKYTFPAPVTALAFSRDGKQLVTGGVHELLVWDATTGKLLSRVPTRAERAHALAFLDERRLVVAGGRPGQEGDVRVYNLADPSAKSVLLYEADDSVLCLAVSADGKRLAAGGTDRLVRVWDVSQTPAKLTHTIDSHADWVLGLAFSPDGKRLASAARDKTAKVWDFAANESIAGFADHTGPVAAVAFAGDRVVSAGADNVLRSWVPAADGKAKAAGGHTDEVAALVPVPGGKLLASGSLDGTVKLWDVGKFAPTQSWPGFGDCVYAVAVSPDGKQLAAGGQTGEVRLFAVADGKELRRFVASPK